MSLDSKTISLLKVAGSDRLTGNSIGKVVFQGLQKEVDNAPGVDVFGISLAGVIVTDASFPRESVVSLVKMHRGEKGFFLEGLDNPDLRDNWDYAAKAKDQPVIVRQGVHDYAVIGPELSPGMRDLLDFTMREGTVTTSKVAKHFGISAQNASAKLKRLYMAGLVLGSKQDAETGGIEYVYRAIC